MGPGSIRACESEVSPLQGQPIAHMWLSFAAELEALRVELLANFVEACHAEIFALE